MPDGVGALAVPGTAPSLKNGWMRTIFRREKKIHPDHHMSVTGRENPTCQPALLLPCGLHPAGAQHPPSAKLSAAWSRQRRACLSCSFQGCSAISNCHKNKCFLLHITEQRNFPPFFSFFFFFFPLLFSEASLKVIPSPSLGCFLAM